jgi:hypothetical protein
VKDKVLFDDNTVRIAAIGDASEVHVWRVVGEGHMRAELLETGLTLVAVAVGVNQAADCSKVAGLEVGDCGADVSDTADDLVSGNAWIDGRHHTPLVTDLVEVRVTDTTEKDFVLNVVFTWIAPGDRDGRKRRFRSRSSISLRFILTT